MKVVVEYLCSQCGSNQVRKEKTELIETDTRRGFTEHWHCKSCDHRWISGVSAEKPNS